MLEKIFAENDVRANVNRAAFENNGIRALDLMSSPGSGKTTVLEGDITTDLDAANGRGTQVSLLNNQHGFCAECHLDAPMVNRALAGAPDGVRRR